MEANGARPNAELRDILDRLLEPVEQLKIALSDRAVVSPAATTDAAAEPLAPQTRPTRGEDILATIAIPSVDASDGGHANAVVSKLERCSMCDGRGFDDATSEDCAVCSGSGRVAKQRVLSVQFPAGVSDGAKLRVAGEGNESTNGSDPGDLFLTVMLVPTRRKRRFPFASS